MLRPVGKCFVQLQIGKKVFRDRVVVIENLCHKYILGHVLHRLYQFSTRYSTTGIHYITINGQVIAQVIPQTSDYPIIKTKGKVTLLPMSVSIVQIKTLKISDSAYLYELNADTFHLPEGVIPLDVLHWANHKTPQYLSIPILNAKSIPCSISKAIPIASMHPAGKFDEVQETSWIRLQCDTSKLLPKMLQNTSLQLEPDTKSSVSSIPDVEIPEEARKKLKELLNKKYLQIISQNMTNIGRTNLIKVDIPMEAHLSQQNTTQYC